VTASGDKRTLQEPTFGGNVDGGARPPHSVKHCIKSLTLFNNVYAVLNAYARVPFYVLVGVWDVCITNFLLHSWKGELFFRNFPYVSGIS
jgi:hypothetical protein